MKNKYYIECECGDEILLISKMCNPFAEEIISLAIYKKYNYNRKPTIIERVKYCWRHLITGKIYNDEIIITKEKAEDLINSIKNNIL